MPSLKSTNDYDALEVGGHFSKKMAFTFIAVFSSAISASMASSFSFEARALQDLQQEDVVGDTMPFAGLAPPPASTSSLSEETCAFGQLGLHHYLHCFLYSYSHFEIFVLVFVFVFSLYFSLYLSF